RPQVKSPSPRPQVKAAGPNGQATPPYVPSQIARFYGLDALWSAGYNGSGQTIGIVSLAALNSRNDLGDVRAFQSSFGLPSSAITVDVLDAPDTEGAEETTLDVTWASALAPGARIVLVETANSTADLVNAIDYMASTYHPTVIAAGWGACDAEVAVGAQDALHSLLSRLNVPVFMPSGDSGSRECDSSGQTSALWPATDPYVTAVGGTSLAPDASGNPASESPWAPSGGGFTMRGVPDVSLLADPATGYVLRYGGHWIGVGGTSASAPALAGMLAVVNQAR